MEPSITSTNGASSSPFTACQNGLRNSSPPSVGESTLLWRWTLGRPGIAPSTTSSMAGWPAAVTATESPSQLIPSEIHRMLTSFTPEAVASAVISSPSSSCQFLLKLERRRHDLAEVSDLDLHLRDAAAGRMVARDPRYRVGYRELVHRQQILGS